MARGWRPTPFKQFLLKIHSRCNLSCDYCYVYASADQSWRRKPMVMPPPILAFTARRIAEHAAMHGLDAITVILHGGEPLLAGHSYLADTVHQLRDTVEPVARVHVGLQTNGILLDEPFIRMFRALDVRVGVSLDGDSATHDRHRRYGNGHGSHADVSQALRLLMRPEHRDVYSGLLCTIDLRNDPITVYEALLAFDPPAVDFLLPHGTWSTPPPGRDHGNTHAPYAEWLIAMFDRWYGSPRRETRVRLFEEILHLLLGGKSGSEAVGLTPTSLVVVETDGSIEQTDALKSAYDGAPVTGLNVIRDSFDAALHFPSIAARQIGIDALADQCLDCSLRRVCGGGFYPHRYRAGSGFRNPSVYCTDLFRLISYIRDRVGADLRARVEGHH
ncbi:MAG: FxsB family radical SAM/SPASM domain protein [Actinomycetota bacterium]|nr:FxsB family radical SAM/SPASM domain protein [Actinomycetota bacterium]